MSATSVQLLRPPATLLLRTGGVEFLVDPMLSEPGAMPPIPNDRRNPLVPLPDVEVDPDAVVVTHTHGQNQTTVAAGDGALAGIVLHRELRRFPLSMEEVDAEGSGSREEAPAVPDEVRERAAVRAAESIPGLVPREGEE